MTLSPPALVPSTRPSPSQSLALALRNVAIHDWLVLGYLTTLNLTLLHAPAGAARSATLVRMLSLLAIELTAVVLVRGGFLKHRFSAALVYRIAVFGTVHLSYFFLADLLPLVRPASLDAELYQLDRMLFGLEPAMAMDPWVGTLTTEWFAFFYYCYFFLLALHVVPILLFCQRARVLGEFALGVLTVFCLGHILYVVVPGFGPYKAMAEDFTHQFPSGLWLDTVMTTVAEGGAQKDIFPSIHTAAPMFIAMFSFHNRHLIPFKFSWPVVAFLAFNIIVATMFLRWHYVIDVVAGLLLAVTAWLVAVHVTAWELRRRPEHQLQPSWPAF